MTNMKLLITGSEGLIGTLLTKKLESNYKISKFDLKLKNNITNFKSLQNEVKTCEGIIHLAALSRVVTAYQNPLLSIKYNILGFANILENIRTINPKIWCIYASSREVYGESLNKVKENDALNPINVYGATKLSSELLADTYHLNYGLRTFIVRFSNVYGGLNDHPDRVIPKFIYQASQGQNITVYGGTQTFDFVHVKDAVNGVTKLISKIRQNKLKNRKFHFVSGKGTNLMELATNIIRITGSSSKVKKMASRNYDVNNFVGNPKFTNNELDWSAKISFEKGLKMYWKEFKKNNLKNK